MCVAWHMLCTKCHEAAAWVGTAPVILSLTYCKRGLNSAEVGMAALISISSGIHIQPEIPLHN